MSTQRVANPSSPPSSNCLYGCSAGALTFCILIILASRGVISVGNISPYGDIVGACGIAAIIVINVVAHRRSNKSPPSTEKLEEFIGSQLRTALNERYLNDTKYTYSQIRIDIWIDGAYSNSVFETLSSPKANDIAEELQKMLLANFPFTRISLKITEKGEKSARSLPEGDGSGLDFALVNGEWRLTDFYSNPLPTQSAPQIQKTETPKTREQEAFEESVANSTYGDSIVGINSWEKEREVSIYFDKYPDDDEPDITSNMTHKTMVEELRKGLIARYPKSPEIASIRIEIEMNYKESNDSTNMVYQAATLKPITKHYTLLFSKRAGIWNLKVIYAK